MALDTHKPQQKNNDNFGLPLEDEPKSTESPRNKRWVRTTIILAGVSLLAGSGVVIWLLQNPSGNIQYLRHKLQEAKVIATDSIANIQQTIVDSIVQINEPETIIPHDTHEIDIPTINSPNGMYYVIMGGYIDIDLAKDHAKQLLQEGIMAKIILPSKGQYFHRLAVAEAASREEAIAIKEELKAKYATDMWVMKY